jgi:chitinase
VKVYVGVPGSPEAAGSGYITPDALEAIIGSVVGQDNFGGVMMW